MSFSHMWLRNSIFSSHYFQCNNVNLFRLVLTWGGNDEAENIQILQLYDYTLKSVLIKRDVGECFFVFFIYPSYLLREFSHK